ncbi:MAG: methyltransferase domain-containing protein [Bryobacterales bacterium]|nr:methyltransferase domain-containing protein [Bryobacterales bacterium]
MEAQSLSVKRAQVEFHNFASMGEPERALRVYGEENARRGAIIAEHLDILGTMTPFLEIGANAGHTSYMLANNFGAEGFALDISADALRHGIALMEQWNMPKAPVRIAADALNLPFRDNSLRFVMTYQTLSQFLDLDAVFTEIKRVLAPGGIFLFAEEPIKRIATLGLYRVGYYDTMKPWERWLYDRGLLGFLVRDVIGARQEESFGIRQNHTMGLKEWQHLIYRHFEDPRYHIFIPRRGWGERAVAGMGRKLDKYASDWVPARLLGGTLAALCRKPGQAAELPKVDMSRFEQFLRCPDCQSPLIRDAHETLRCAACGYEAANEGGVYTVIRSAERKELYPGDQPDVIDFSMPGHEKRLLAGWDQLEGVFGNKYRWIQDKAVAKLEPTRATPQRLRIRGFAHESCFTKGEPVRVNVTVNNTPLETTTLNRPGLFVLEAGLPQAPSYTIELSAQPRFQTPPDERWLSVHISMLRLVDRD